MIIVYYDSAVQTAFEEMVKFISGSRNAMRKGKMAAKMAEMRRAAEMEVEAEGGDSSDEEGEGVGLNDMLSSGNLMAARRKVTVGTEGQSLTPGEKGGKASSMPKLDYVSTRQMGPSRGGAKGDNIALPLSATLRGYRRGLAGAPDIFDQLDKGLEWCQSQCEHAAHQFLRDGECETEIANIKKKLFEVKEAAEKEVERLQKEEIPSQPAKTQLPDKGRIREHKTPQIRKDLSSLKDLQVDDMEVDDDEGVDDLEIPTKATCMRTGQT